jgi:hypothetical protein
MSSEAKPIGQFEFELTDELATRTGLALCRFQQLRVKKPQLRKPLFNHWLFLGIGLSLLLLALSFFRSRRRGDNSIGDWIVSEWLAFIPLSLLAFFLLLLLFLEATVGILPRLVEWLVPWLFLRRARKLAHRRIHYALYEDRFERQAADGARIVPWSKLREIHAVPGFWFLTLQSRRTLCIPAQALPAEIQSLIGRKASEAGVTVEYWALQPVQVMSK